MEKLKNRYVVKTETKNLRRNAEQIKIVAQTRKIPIQKCFLCNKEMKQVKGDTLYCEKWFHNDCWKSLVR